jgi:GDP/UDP-N,N'-diacetylbacillosamine 2-epimerase (hydrolysing)
MPPNVINCGYSTDEILKAMDKAKKYDRTKTIKNPYGDGHSSKRIVRVLEEIK